MELINEDSPRRSLVNVRVGKNVRFFNFINAYGCEIGDNTRRSRLDAPSHNSKMLA